MLWVLLLVPILSVLGLEAPPSPLEPDETFERAPPRPLEILRPEPGEIGPGPASKQCGAGKPALTLRAVTWTDASRPLRVSPDCVGAPTLHGRQSAHPWCARGPPVAAV